MEIVGEVTNPLELLRASWGASTDVVLITPLQTNGGTNICTHLLASYPKLKIVTLSENGKDAYLHRSDLPRLRIDEGSGQRLLDAIVEAIRQTASDRQ